MRNASSLLGLAVLLPFLIGDAIGFAGESPPPRVNPGDRGTSVPVADADDATTPAKTTPKQTTPAETGGASKSHKKHVATDPAAALEARRDEYLKKHSTLSKASYDRLFAGACDQRNSRDCFLLAALGAIPISHREALFRTSIKPDAEGCVVNFPFGVSEQTSIRVYRRDLRPEVVAVDGRRTVFQPVHSSDGWKALEAAYILLAYGRDANGQVNRQAAAGGDPVTVLERIVKTKRSARIVLFERNEPLARNPKIVSQAVETLNAFDPDRHMLTLGSLDAATQDYLIDGIKFRKRHAYVAAAVDREQQRVMLINPHDSTRPLVIGYGTLVNAFRVLRRIEFDAESTYK